MEYSRVAELHQIGAVGAGRLHHVITEVRQRPVRRRSFIMLYYPPIRSFLSNHYGYYCEECLAERLNLSVDKVRRSVGQRTLADVAVAYRICQSCVKEKTVFALRKCA